MSFLTSWSLCCSPYIPSVLLRYHSYTCSLRGSDSGVCYLLFLWALVHGYLLPYEHWGCWSEFRFLGTFSVGMLRGLTLRCFPPGRIYVFQRLQALQTQGHFKCLPWGLFSFQNTLIGLCGGWALLWGHFVVINSCWTINFPCCFMKSSLFLLYIHPEDAALWHPA